MTPALALASATLFLGGVPAPRQMDDVKHAVAALEGVGSVGFGLLRTRPAGAGESLRETAMVMRPGTISRVLWDPASGVYFGYRVDIGRDETGFRLSFRPLDDDEVARRAIAGRLASNRPAGTSPRPLAATPRFPPPQTLTEDEILTLQLLANPQTGEKVYDVLKVSALPITPEAMAAAIGRARTGQTALLRAAILVARGLYWEAVEKYREALEIQPRDAVIRNKLGICYQKLDNQALARREYELALRLDPDYAEVWNNIGTVEQSADRLEAAVKAYKKAIALRPDLATAWKNLGNAYFALERFDEAFDAFQEAYRLDPAILESQGMDIAAVDIDLANLHYHLAKLLAANGQVDQSLEFLRLAREAGFDDFDQVRQDADFETVIEDPRFEALAGR